MTYAELSTARRWLLFALVITAGILNLVDRQIIAVLKPVISKDLGWTDNDYGTLAAWFQGGAAVAFLFTGWIADKLGVKWANPLGVAAWSIAAMLHGWAQSTVQFVMVRVALGATEAMGTPVGIKSIAAILPPALRSSGYGAMNAANSIGAILAPLAIPLVALSFGWRATFVAAGMVGILWAGIWLVATRGLSLGAPARTAPAAAASAAATPDRYGPILTERRTWAIAVAKVLSDATWWLMLFWLPDFFNREFGLSGVALGVPLAIAYSGAAAGSLLGGGISTQEKVGRVTAFGAFSGNIGGLVIAKVAGLVLSAGLGYLPLFGFAAISYLLAIGWIQLLVPVIRTVDGPPGAREIVPAH
ncbi:MFS transporter [Sphingomonas sp. CCH16-B10]|uniref:MFS transporter n=1 Tax=Sphingomonas sp. CCH16-B10 TaxID=1768755 RepID=UPI00083379AF|nr:MFS transporter [Sphingomonas sp. CCH16-B10]